MYDTKMHIAMKSMFEVSFYTRWVSKAYQKY